MRMSTFWGDSGMGEDSHEDEDGAITLHSAVPGASAGSSQAQLGELFSLRFSQSLLLFGVLICRALHTQGSTHYSFKLGHPKPQRPIPLSSSTCRGT